MLYIVYVGPYPGFTAGRKEQDYGDNYGDKKKTKRWILFGGREAIRPAWPHTKWIMEMPCGSSDPPPDS